MNKYIYGNKLGYELLASIFKEKGFKVSFKEAPEKFIMFELSRFCLRSDMVKLLENISFISKINMNDRKFILEIDKTEFTKYNNNIPTNI